MKNTCLLSLLFALMAGMTCSGCTRAQHDIYDNVWNEDADLFGQPASPVTEL